MDGTMMKYPLTLTSLLRRAGKLFPAVEVVSRRPDKTVHRYTYRDFHARALALCAGLQRAGIKRGDRVATLMWNHAAHLECYFGIPAAGGVLHTLNLRLHPDELSYIANHAQDRFLIVDDVLLHLYEQIKDKVRFERVFVVQQMCESLPANCESYESLLDGPVGPVDLIDVDENEAAAMCYTSGTTGKPKGVVYSHRALALHSLSIALPDHFNIARRDVILPAMSMFHANAWGLPYAAVMTGCKLVFPGPDLQPESLLNAMQEEKVTLTGAVPTVWLAVLECLERDPGRWKLEDGMRILVAGSAAPEMLFRGFDKFGITIIQPWGMTETTPICTFSVPKPHMQSWPEDRKHEVRAKQGLPSPFIDLRAVGENGEIPWDGEAVGELQVRGPWVTASYFNLPEQPDSWTEDGWLRTGDVVNIDSEGYIKITDRAKDLIKSGGEWISSVDLENALVAHPGIAEAAVIAVAHPKWQERPLALIVGAPNLALPTVNELREFLLQKFAKWQLPDDFVFVEELPHTSTGKLLKTAMRERFKDWYSNSSSD
jgi:fatty-acyl-CoA synthase